LLAGAEEREHETTGEERRFHGGRTVSGFAAALALDRVEELRQAFSAGRGLDFELVRRLTDAD
jgi:hypothetical protein